MEISHEQAQREAEIFFQGYWEGVRQMKEPNEVKRNRNAKVRSCKTLGDFFDDCLHLHCNKIIATFCKEQKDNEWEVGWIEEWLMDKYCDNCEQEESCTLNPLICELIIKEYKENDNE